ncbi:MAG: DUF1302 family protein [bacterium]
MLRRQAWLAWLVGGAVLAIAAAAQAIFLDEDQNITLRARIYSQAAIRTENSEVFTEPDTKTGQLVQQRNFFNPELDAKLTPYLNWMNGGAFSWLSPDDLRFRIAGWGFYDGIYDYGSAQFDQSQKVINASFRNGVPIQTPVRTGGWYGSGHNIKLCNPGAAGSGCTRPSKFSDVFPGFDESVPRSIYANQARVNELYLSYSKGPFFLRVGKQSISWGESDTVALLDQSNPFDLTLGAPGFFEDIDEARIPLFTVRTSYNVFDTLGPLSSGFVEGYWVPGGIDTTTAITPSPNGASPYSPRGVDPQLLSGLPGGVFPPTFQFVLFDHTPQSDIGSSRWGVRFQTVIERFLTLQAWVYRTFPNVVPQKLGYANSQPLNINGTNFFVVSLEHHPVMVYGLAGTFFSETLDGIFRLNAQLFEHEQGFVPQTNLNICPINSKQNAPCGPGRNPISSPGHIPYQDILRYEIGFDRFFFARFLNPSNSFVLSTSIVGSYNASYTGNPANHFRFNGQLKPGPVCFRGNGKGDCEVFRQRGSFQDDYINTYPLDAQGQITMQTDYWHGRLSPRMTYIQFVRGTAALHPSIIYRWNDWLLFQADYQYISGAYQSLGFFRDRDQVSVRMTYQLN